MLTLDQLKICNELVELYKAQMPFVEPEQDHEWTTAELESFEDRAERISNLQRQLVSPATGNSAALKVGRPIIRGSWQDR